MPNVAGELRRHAQHDGHQAAATLLGGQLDLRVSDQFATHDRSWELLSSRTRSPVKKTLNRAASKDSTKSAFSTIPDHPKSDREYWYFSFDSGNVGDCTADQKNTPASKKKRTQRSSSSSANNTLTGSASS